MLNEHPDGANGPDRGQEKRAGEYLIVHRRERQRKRAAGPFGIPAEEVRTNLHERPPAGNRRKMVSGFFAREACGVKHKARGRRSFHPPRLQSK